MSVMTSLRSPASTAVCTRALIISSVSAYHGYFTSGGALEVGRSSTKAVVYAVVIVMVANLLLTQMLLG